MRKLTKKYTSIKKNAYEKCIQLSLKSITTRFHKFSLYKRCFTQIQPSQHRPVQAAASDGQCCRRGRRRHCRARPRPPCRSAAPPPAAARAGTCLPYLYTYIYLHLQTVLLVTEIKFLDYRQLGAHSWIQFDQSPYWIILILDLSNPYIQMTDRVKNPYALICGHWLIRRTKGCKRQKIYMF